MKTSKNNRTGRIRKLEKVIVNKPIDKTYVEVISEYMIDEGLSIRIVNEYLKVLRLTGRIDDSVRI